MHENTKNNSNNHNKKFHKKKYNKKSNSQSNSTHVHNVNHSNHNNFNKHNSSGKHNSGGKQKKNQHHKYYGNRKTIEEYERIYIERRRKEEGEKPICPICNEAIYIIEEAIIHNKSNEYAHFECILNEIKIDNIDDIEKNEKVVYLGAGTFGIIQERQGGKHPKIFVKKRINYENRKIKKVNDDSDPEEEELFNV